MTSDSKLSGGNVNNVVRRGVTVHRSPNKATPTIHRLLRHARAQGIDWIPEPLGFDDQEREILSYMPGEVPHDMPGWIWSESILLSIAHALRQWHDATANFDSTGATWNLAIHEPSDVICHNDFAPYNCAFIDKKFCGAFDFDFCSPGPRIHDLAYAAYRFIPLMPPADAQLEDNSRERSPFSVAEMRLRCATFLAAYAGPDNQHRFATSQLIAAAIARLAEIADWNDTFVASGGNPDLALNARMYRAHAHWLESQNSSLPSERSPADLAHGDPQFL